MATGRIAEASAKKTIGELAPDISLILPPYVFSVPT
jgi:hypothetical protein